MPLEISHLVSAIVGAAGYIILQTLQPSIVDSEPAKARKAAKAGGSASCARSPRPENNQRTSCQEVAPAAPRHVRRQPQRCTSRTEVAITSDAWTYSHGPARPSARPVRAPTFHATGWEAEVQELLARISPTPEGNDVVAQLARLVKKSIFPVLPEAEVVGFTSSNLGVGAAFGVAVPEVDIVISVNPDVLLARLQGRWANSRDRGCRLDARKLQKSAIRACTDRLVGTGAFKFRRSAFRGHEPRVTIIAPASTLGVSDQGIPMNLSVNSATPIYSAALLTECGQIEPRAQDLILLVKRWAKDRGLCHASKGHMTPYAWMLLAIYFLQVADHEEGPLLPPLAGFKVSRGLMVKGTPHVHLGQKASSSRLTPTRSAAMLFKDFVHFYNHDFDWRNEAVSVRLGRRAPADVGLPLHIILHEDRHTCEVGPSVEDPFEEARNLGACMSFGSMARLREEFRRAEDLMASGASLTMLLQPWAPADVAQTRAEDDDDDEQ